MGMECQERPGIVGDLRTHVWFAKYVAMRWRVYFVVRTIRMQTASECTSLGAGGVEIAAADMSTSAGVEALASSVLAVTHGSIRVRGQMRGH